MFQFLWVLFVASFLGAVAGAVGTAVPSVAAKRSTACCCSTNARTLHTQTLLMAGSVLVLGGFAADSVLADAERVVQ